MRIAILGSGPGGYVAALRAAQLGASVTVIEEHEVGGTCLNWGCIPTKTLIASAELLSRARNAEEFGVEINGTVTANLARIIERKNAVVSTLVKGIRGLFRNHGISLKEGRGRLLTPRSLELTPRNGPREEIHADAIIIATGSRPAQLPALTFDGSRIISSTDALSLTEIPKTMLIVGAGAIGCEFAFIFNSLGTEVTIIEMLPRAVATEDMEISALLERELRKRKISLHTSASITRASVSETSVQITLSDGRQFMAEKVLVSVGRAFNADSIGLDAAGVSTGSHGELTVNSSMQTNIPGVYGVGDVTGGLLLAHVASREGMTAAEHIMGKPSVMDYSVVPAAIFTMPEIASVGIREHQAAAQGLPVRTGRFHFRSLGKAHAQGDIAGFCKIIADTNTDRVLGAHIIGPHASDLIHEAAVAIRAGLSVRAITETIHAHPTLSECLLEASEDVHDKAIHALSK